MPGSARNGNIKIPDRKVLMSQAQKTGISLKMLRIVHVACICALGASGVPAFAAPAEVQGILLDAANITGSDIERAGSRNVLSLFDLYALSVANTERLAIEGENNKRAEARHDGAFGAFLPKLSLRMYKTLPEPGSGSNFPPRSNINLYARQNLITGLDEYTNYKGTAAEQRMRGYTLQHEAGRLLYDVSAAYLYALRVQKSLGAKQNIRDNYSAISAEIDKRVRLGRSRRSELLMVQSRIYTLDAEITSLTNELSRATNALRTLTGISNNALFEEDPVIPEPRYMSLDPASLAAKRYDIKAKTEETHIAKSATLAARGGHLPDVYLEGSYRLYQKNMNGQDYYAGLGATLPLFNGGMTSAAVREAESAERQTGLALSQARKNAEREIRDAFTSYLGTLAEKESYKKALDMAEQNYGSVLGEYRLSLVSILDVLNALTELEDARDALDAVTLDHTLSRITLGVSCAEFSGQGMQSLRDMHVQAEKKP